MRVRIFSVVIVILLIIGYFFGNKFGVIGLVNALAFPPEIEGSISLQQIRNPVSNQNVRFVVYLPPYYDSSEKSYPVIYHLHGASPFSADATLNIVQSDVTLLAAKLEQVQPKGMPEAIIVAPYDGDGFSLWSDSKDGEVQAESSLVYVLIPHIESNYRTLNNREDRIIQGFSMGGFGAVKNALKYPDLFSVVVNYDGVLHDWEALSERRPSIVENIFANDKAYFDLFSPWTMPVNQSQYPFRLKSNIGMVSDYNEKLKYHLDAQGIDHDYIQTDCGHDMGCLLEVVGKETFEFIANSRKL